MENDACCGAIPPSAAVRSQGVRSGMLSLEDVSRRILDFLQQQNRRRELGAGGLRAQRSKSGGRGSWFGRELAYRRAN